MQSLIHSQLHESCRVDKQGAKVSIPLENVQNLKSQFNFNLAKKRVQILKTTKNSEKLLIQLNEINHGQWFLHLVHVFSII